jgi:hypothetical protein
MNSETREKKARVWARDGLDFYVEPEAASAALFRAERFVGDIYDPACGGGNIVRSALAAGYGAHGSDIRRRTTESWFTREIDFLNEPLAQASANVVTNPPFFRGVGTEQFIRRALAFTTGKVAIFTSIKFLAGAARTTGIYTEFPPSRVWILAPRPSCPPGEYLAAGGKASGGTEDWIWLVWSRDTAAPARFPQLGWLDTREARRP